MEEDKDFLKRSFKYKKKVCRLLQEFFIAFAIKFIHRKYNFPNWSEITIAL